MRIDDDCLCSLVLCSLVLLETAQPEIVMGSLSDFSRFD
jgi:hypothetical protein